jgi:Ca-activated chloride channel family protein
MSEFHFLRPLWFVALIPALLLLLLLWRQRSRGGEWQPLVAPALLAHLLLETGQTVRRLPLLLLGLGWLLAVVALAGPTWQRQPQPVFNAPADRVIVLDMSPSMAATDLKPDRLTRARFVIRDLLSGLQEGRTALVVFGAEPHVVTPLTDDRATIEALLPALSVDIIPAPGDRAGPALRTAGTLLQRVGSTRGTVLLLSDGFTDPADSLDAVRQLRGQGVQVSVIGVGTTQGAPVPAAGGGFDSTADGAVQMARLDEAGLAALASAGAGRYQRSDAVQPDSLIEQTAGHDLTHAQQQDGHGLERWVEQGPWLLLPLLIIAAAGFRRGWLGVLVVLLLPPPPAQAFGWQDLWLRPDQQASRLLQQGDPKTAAERFQDPHWRATARYQAGDYAGAAEGFAGDQPDSAYNRGNALARDGRLQEALAAYDAALERQADHADARFNRELVEQLLREQQSQSEQSPQSGAPQDSQQGNESKDQKTGGGAQDSQQGNDSKDQPAGNGAQDSQQGSDSKDRPAGNGAQDSQQGSGSKGQPAGNGAQDQQQGSDSKDQQAGNGAQDSQQVQEEPAGGDANPSATEPSQRADAGADQAQPAGDQPEDRASDASPSAAASPADVQQGGQDKPGAEAQAAPSGQPSAAQASEQDAAPPRADSAAQARADVAPSAGEAAAAASAADQPVQKTEQDIAMEQWLRQVPDDPAGLLRRKFMLEHLRRLKGQPTP